MALRSRRADNWHMTILVKGSIKITLDKWLRAQHPNSTVTPERYIELYRAELQREGWSVVAAPSPSGVGA